MNVTKGFKGLDLVDRVPEELWMEVCNILCNIIRDALDPAPDSERFMLKRKVRKKRCMYERKVKKRKLYLAISS